MKIHATALCSTLVVLLALSQHGVAAAQATAIADLVSGAGVIGASNFDVVIKVDDLPFLEDEDEDAVEDLFPNINMVGMSYDLLKGNPHPIGGGRLDPGWRFELFETNYDANDTVFFGTQEYRVPDGVQVASCPVCNLEFSSSEAQTAEEYTSSLHVNVKVGGRARKGLARASFKGSSDVKELQSRSSETNNFLMESSAECSFYCPRIRFDDAPRLSAQFREAVLALPATYDEDAYDRFLDLFGTHFAIGVTMGGTFGVRHEISEASLQTMEQLGVDVRSSASFSAMSFSGSANVMTNSQKDQASAFSERTESQSTFSYGGQPIGNPADPADTSLWLDAVRADPLPISYELADIADLLTDEFFPGDDHIAAKRVNVASSLETYCERLEEQGEIICDEPPPPALGPEYPYQECVARGGYYELSGFSDEIGSPGATLTWRECQAKCNAKDWCNAWLWRSARHPGADKRRTCRLGAARSDEFTFEPNHVSCASGKCLDCVSSGPAAEFGAMPQEQTDLQIEFLSRANTRCCMPDQTCVSVCLEQGGQYVSRETSQRLCEARGGALCTHAQIASNVCAGTGCGYNNIPVWIADEGSTRGVHKKYALSAEPTYWTDARAQCESTGGQLPSLHHEVDNDALLDFYTTETTFVDMWIGAYDIETEGIFEWSDGSPFDYENWRGNEPNNGNGNEHCAIMETDSTLWDDRNCVTQLQFACEYPLTASDNTRYLASRIGPDGLLDSFDDFYAWHQVGRPTLTELRIRHTADFVPTIQAVYGSFVLSQHGYHDPALQPDSFKLEVGEHIVSVDACFLVGTGANSNNIRGLRFRTSNNRESQFFGSAISASTPGCRTFNFPSRLLYLSGESRDATLRSLTFHHYPRPASSE